MAERALITADAGYCRRREGALVQGWRWKKVCLSREERARDAVTLLSKRRGPPRVICGRQARSHWMSANSHKRKLASPTEVER